MDNAPGRKPYVKPRLRKDRRLAEVAEGSSPTVTDGLPEKGGCFRRRAV